MAITQAVTTTFKLELMNGVHDFSTDTFKVALYSPNATLDQTIAVYTGVNEVVGEGYTAGGNTLTLSVAPTYGNNLSGVGTAYVSFNNTSWPNSTITTRGALIYNSSKANRSVAVIDFGLTKISNNDILVINFPTPDANNAIVRIS